MNFLELAQTLQMAIKALQMYTPAHPRCLEALHSLSRSIQAWLQEKPSLTMSASSGKLFIDGNPVEGQSLHATALIRQLSERQIAGFVIQNGVEEDELLAMLQILVLKPAKIEEQGGVARVMVNFNLRHISLSQTQYREVREGEGGQEDRGGTGKGDASSQTATPATDSTRELSAPSPSVLLGISAALQQWKIQLLASNEPLSRPTSGSGPTGGEGGSLASGRILGTLPKADLAHLGLFAKEAGWDDDAPTEFQLEALHQALQALPPETRLSILKGIDSLPLSPLGLHKGFNQLAPNLFSSAATELLTQGVTWKSLRENLFSILGSSPLQRSMLASFETGLKQHSLDMGYLQDLFKQLEWESLTIEDKIRKVVEGSHLWELSLEQRLSFLRELLEKGRKEAFLQILDEILGNLSAEDETTRDMAARTTSGITHWITEPGIPEGAEGPLQQALIAHFGWEPLLYIHRPTEESLDNILISTIRSGDVARAHEKILELEGLCAFLEDKQEWRQQALERLKARLSNAEILGLAIEALYKAEPEAVLAVFLPYFEYLGEPAAAMLVKTLGEEAERKNRGRLLDIIRVLGPLAMPSLQDGLHAPMWYVVRNTLNLLADMGDAGLLQDVASCLNHEDGRVRRAAVRALWKLGGPASSSHLLSVFLETDPETQIEILFGLGHIQSTAAVPVLCDFAKQAQRQERLRIRAIEVIGQIGSPSAIPGLTDLIRRKGRIFTSAEPLDIRLAAARALLSIGTPAAKDVLRKTVADESKGHDRDALKHVLDLNG